MEADVPIAVEHLTGSGIFRNWRRLHAPLSLNRPVFVEVGFGDGRFLRWMARQHPEAWWLGIEVSSHALQKCLKAAHREGLRNLLLVRGDAVQVLRRLFPEPVVEGLFLLFPDPWPKSRHERRRIYALPLLKELIRVLRAGGTFALATDHPLVYALTREALVHLSGTFRSPDQEIWFPTKYEHKWRNMGRSIHRLVWQKDTDPNLVPHTPEEEDSMPHIRLPREALQSALDIRRGEVIRLRHGVMKILGIYRHEQEWLISTLVVDPPLGVRQPIHYLLHPYRDGALLHLEHPAEVLITPAVKEGLRWLAKRFSP